jgi:hypothetical protein
MKIGDREGAAAIPQITPAASPGRVPMRVEAVRVSVSPSRVEREMVR